VVYTPEEDQYAVIAVPAAFTLVLKIDTENDEHVGGGLHVFGL
jgi:hypothetical protein